MNDDDNGNKHTHSVDNHSIWKVFQKILLYFFFVGDNYDYDEKNKTKI